MAPGLASGLMTPRQALLKAEQFIAEWGPQAVIGVAGPGEPLANPETLEALQLIRSRYPLSILCLCTNGLNLPESLEALQRIQIQHLSVTINGIDPEIVARLQPWVLKNGQRPTGEAGARLLIENQLRGVKYVAQLGIIVKVNCVVIPALNGSHIGDVAARVGALGARVFNPMPLLPRGLFASVEPPTELYMEQIRLKCRSRIAVFSSCKQCRADAEGIPGREICRFVPLCFTKYVLVTPKGNPGNIHGIQDLARPGIKTVLSPQASPPGGEASTLILKKAGVLEAAIKNAVVSGDCVHRVFPEVTPGGKGDVAVMEMRLTRKAGFDGKTETIEIPEEFIPDKPVPFVIGLMKWAHNREMAEDFIRFATSEKGQSFFAAAGFIPANSGEGERLIQKYGVHDA